MRTQFVKCPDQGNSANALKGCEEIGKGDAGPLADRGVNALDQLIHDRDVPPSWPRVNRKLLEKSKSDTHANNLSEPGPPESAQNLEIAEPAQ